VQKLEPVYLFGDRTRQDGFFTVCLDALIIDPCPDRLSNTQGTYQYLSHHLERAPFHHGCHDLDSLFWSLNKLPLTLEGPGGKKRRDQPTNIIETYYNGGPNEKYRMAMDFVQTQQGFEHMMSHYTDYFKDLMPFMEKWYGFVQVACGFRGSYEYHHPHRILAEIIEDAINKLGLDAEEGYEHFAREEKRRREQEMVDMAEAISKRMTIAALLKYRRFGTAPVANTENPTIPAPAAHKTPPRASIHLPIHIPTAQSPETGRVVKRSRANSPALED
jgi:hypothetical protein